MAHISFHYFSDVQSVHSSPFSLAHTTGPEIGDITREEEPHPSISEQVCQERVLLFPLLKEPG